MRHSYFVPRMNVVEDTIKHQLDRDFYELINLVAKELGEAQFDQRAISRFDDEGGCLQDTESLNVKEFE